MAVFEACVEKGWALEGVISQSETQLKNLWRLREDISARRFRCLRRTRMIFLARFESAGFSRRYRRIVSAGISDI